MTYSVNGQIFTTLQEIVESLSSYASGVADKDIAIVTNQEHHTGLTPGTYIKLDSKFAMSPEDAFFHCKVRVTLEAAVLKCADETIDKSVLPKSWQAKIHEESPKIDRYGIREVESQRFWEGFSTLMKILELGRVRQRVKDQYPALDEDIDKFVLGSEEEGRNRRKLKDDMENWPDVLRKESAGLGRSSYSIQIYEERETVLTCKELSYILLISDETTVGQELAKLTEKSQRIYNRVFPVLSSPDSTRADSVRLAIELMKDEFREDRDMHEKTDMERKNEENRKNHKQSFPQFVSPVRGIAESIDNLGQSVRFAGRKDENRENIEKFKIDEWDSNSRVYLRNACVVLETPGPDNWVGAKKITPRFGFSEREVAEIRDALRSLKPEGKVTSKRLRSGEVDFDQWVKYRMEKLSGSNPEERFYMKSERRDRDVAQLLLWDVSGSTLGYCSKTALKQNMRIIDMQMYGILHYICAARELGDDIALFSYNSSGRKNVRVRRLMGFGSDMDTDQLKSAVLDVVPGNNNHDGSVLRHALHNHLAYHTARTRMLVHLTDGVPEDKTMTHMGVSASSNRSMQLADYEGSYAIEDVRKALEEYDSRGIITFGISFAQEKLRPRLQEIWGTEYKMLKTPYGLGKKLAQIMREKTLV